MSPASFRSGARRRAGTTPQHSHATHLDDLKTIVDELTDSLAKGVRQWLHGRNRLLDGDRPIDRLRNGEFDAVYKAAQAFGRGYYV